MCLESHCALAAELSLQHGTCGGFSGATVVVIPTSGLLQNATADISRRDNLLPLPKECTKFSAFPFIVTEKSLND